MHALRAHAAPPPERGSVLAFFSCVYAQACCSLEPAAGKTERGRARRERPVLLAQWPLIGYGPTQTSVVQRARVVSARAAPTRERARGGAFACAHTRTSAACWRPQLARRSTAVHRGIGPSRWRGGLLSIMSQLQPARCSARAPQARVLCLLPRESACWRVRVCAHANAGCSLEAAAGTSEHGRASRERAVLMAQWASITL